MCLALVFLNLEIPPAKNFIKNKKKMKGTIALRVGKGISGNKIWRTLYMYLFPYLLSLL